MDKKQRAQQIYDLFKTNLTEHNIRFDPHDDDLVISMTVNGDDLPQPTLILVQEDREVVQLISPLPTKMPEDKRIDGAVAVSVANYGLVNGSFDFDISDGEIRYRVTQSFANAVLNKEIVEYLLAVIFSTTDKYNDKFFMLAKGMLSLEDFLKAEENK